MVNAQQMLVGGLNAFTHLLMKLSYLQERHSALGAFGGWPPKRVGATSSWQLAIAWPEISHFVPHFLDLR